METGFFRGVIFFTIMVLLVILSISAQAEDLPLETHLTWDHDDTAHTVVVTWVTKEADSGDIVRYDSVSHMGDSGYRYTATGIHNPNPDEDEYFHEVELTNLTPDTVYCFTAGGMKGGFGAERQLRTAPDQSTNITFVVGGDSRTNPEMRDNISRSMASFNPSFVIYTGDAVNNGTSEAEWDDWFAGMDKYWISNQSSLTIPIIPALGNHEKNATLYYMQYGLPGNHRWYSLDWGPDLHIIVLDSYSDIAGEERSWLENDLATHANTSWKAVFFHEPVFSGGEHGSNIEERESWVPLFDKYRVDLVVTGHDHGYERTYPINLSISNQSPVTAPDRGTVYIVSAGWGATLYKGTPRWWSSYGPVSKYQFTLIDLDAKGSLRIRAIDQNGSVFDESRIQRNILSTVDSTSNTSFQTMPQSGIDLYAVVCTVIVGVLILSRNRRK